MYAKRTELPDFSRKPYTLTASPSEPDRGAYEFTYDGGDVAVTVEIKRHVHTLKDIVRIFEGFLAATGVSHDEEEEAEEVDRRIGREAYEAGSRRFDKYGHPVLESEDLDEPGEL